MKSILIALVAVVLIAVGSFVFYTVDEAKQAIIVQFGEPIGGVISEPGLKVKLPWQQVRYFDKRLLVWDGDVTQIPTLGREFILVDTTARWRIADPLLFLTSVRDEAGARTRLDDIVDSVVRDMVGVLSGGSPAVVMGIRRARRAGRQPDVAQQLGRETAQLWRSGGAAEKADMHGGLHSGQDLLRGTDLRGQIL